MALEKIEVVVLKLFNWSESSRTGVFFSREKGKIALVDKGGRTLKSKRGRLLPFTKMELTYYGSEKETRGYISDVELIQSYNLEGEGSLGRLTFASAGCELLYLLLPEEEPQGSLYGLFVTFLELIASAPRQSLSSIFICFFIRVLSQLGFHPSLRYCVACNKEIGEDTDSQVMFSPERGGVIEPACHRATDYYIQLSPEVHRLFLKLETASLKEAATIETGYRQTIQMIDVLAKFIEYQSSIKTDLKSLAFLEKLKNSESLK